MGMTMTQKILAAHAGLPSVSAGQLIEADLDLVLGNDITSPVAIHEMDKMKVDGVFDKDKIALVLDHFVPNKDIKSAQHCKCVREFACRHDITNYFDVGEMGIEHALLPEKGLTVAGDVIIGADSHTCTYGALGAFSTGVGSTDMAAGMATGKAWFKVPESLLFKIEGELAPGVTGKDMHELAERVLADHGFAGKMGHGLGHGVGIDIHEEPNLSPRNPHPLVPGNVVTVEPGLYYSAWGGVRWEYTVLVEEGGVRIL